MNILAVIFIGLVVGAVAKLMMPGRDPGGIFITIALGIVGAVVGTFVGRALGLYTADRSAGFLMSIIGAMILLFVYRLIVGRRSRAHVV